MLESCVTDMNPVLHILVWGGAFGLALLACSGSGSDPGPPTQDGATGQASGGTNGVGGSIANEVGTKTGGSPSEAGGASNASGGTSNSAVGGSPAQPPAGSYRVCTPWVSSTVASPEIGVEGDGKSEVGQMGFFDQPELTPNPALPQGRMVEFTMKSAESSFYPGIKGPYERRVKVFVPSQYIPGTQAPFIIGNDGYDFQIPSTLNNLIPGKCLPVMIGIFVGNGGGDAPGSQRGLEYDTVSGTFGQFLIAEVLPRVELEAGVLLTTDPEGGALVGTSSGAAGAFTAAWFHPERFRRVISYSGTFVDLQSGQDDQSKAAEAMYPYGAWEYHQNIIPLSPLQPLRTWLMRGEFDSIIGSPTGRRNWQVANDNMFTALIQKGHHVQYQIALGRGHSEDAPVGFSIPQAMMWVWRGYPLQ